MDIKELKRLAEAALIGKETDAGAWKQYFDAVRPAAVLALIAENERLRAELTGMTEYHEGYKEGALENVSEAAEQLRAARAELAASQEREKALREALEESHALNANWSGEAEPETLAYYSEYRTVLAVGENALALPADDTALREMLAQREREAIERVAALVEDNWFRNQGEVVAAIRALEVKP